MTSPVTSSEQPHLVTLVLQSQKALQQGEQLCTRANGLSSASAESAVDVLALDAKVKWMSEAIIEQLHLAVAVSKSIKEKRDRLNRRVNEWDKTRIEQSDALESMLNALGAQKVPPEFHQSSETSSLFGSQHSAQSDLNKPPSLPQSPSNTLRANNAREEDRRLWKTLRDFVDDQAIEDILESIENERNVLDDIISQTDDFPETLNSTIDALRAELPSSTTVLDITQALTQQDGIISKMAKSLESLAVHYDQMDGALRELEEGGEPFSNEELQEMNRDTEELPVILSELEVAATAMNQSAEHLKDGADAVRQELVLLSSVLDELDELGDIMGDMIQKQAAVETEVDDRLDALQQQVFGIENLYDRFINYQAAFNKLVVEIARRRVYKEAAENIVQRMVAQLEAMTQEESDLRRHFNEEYGEHLPDDLCLSIGNQPTRWDVAALPGEIIETLPEIPQDMVRDARERITTTTEMGSF